MGRKNQEKVFFLGPGEINNEFGYCMQLYSLTTYSIYLSNQIRYEI